MSFDLNILVNGNRCKQYYHQGKTFIEAKNGSEYVIEIKNNHWKRVLAVGSVDGLNVLTGKTASNNDTGYIVGSYSSEKIKGFRFSNDEWAMFKFGYKFYGNTYAQSKEDGSEKNCGVIGLRVFYEKEPVITYTPAPPIIINNPPCPGPHYPPWPHWPTWNDHTITCRGLGGYSGGGGTGYSANVNYTCNNLGAEDVVSYNATLSSTVKDTSSKIGKNSKKRSAGGGQSATATNFSDCCSSLIGSDDSDLHNYCGDMSLEQPKQEFDMGTEWGRKEYSKVHNVTFERGCLAQSFDIYYASREALINMGVPIINQLSVNLPQSFPNGYAQPPKNWNG